MTFKEFQDKMNGFIKAHPEANDKEIVVVTNDSSLGPISNTDIEGLYMGIDWESSLVLISTTDKIYKEPIQKQNKTKMVENIKITKNKTVRKMHQCANCLTTVNSNDNFCKVCGRRFVK